MREFFSSSMVTATYLFSSLVVCYYLFFEHKFIKKVDNIMHYLPNNELLEIYETFNIFRPYLRQSLHWDLE